MSNLSILNNNIYYNNLRARPCAPAHVGDQKPNKIEQLKTRAKHFLESKNKGTSQELSTETQKEINRVNSIALVYEEALGRYNFKSNLRYLKGRISIGTKTYQTWLRAANFADAMQVSYETYVNAQFWAIHAWYGRAAKPSELASFNSKISSKLRVDLYLEYLKQNGKSDQPIAGSILPVPEITQSLKNQHSNFVLRQFMRNYGISEEEVLKRFAFNEYAYCFFDKAWLASNPTYQKLKSSNS